MAEKHSILEGKVHLYKRNNSPVWQCSAYLAGKNRRASTKEKSLARAKDVAQDWFFTLRDQERTGALIHEKTFADAAMQFVKEYALITNGERNPEYAKSHEARLKNHLLPFFGSKGLSQVTAGLMQEYRIQRLNPADGSKKPSRSTMHHDEVTLRQVMKCAQRHGWIENLPDFSAPYKSSGKVEHRAWFSKEEYKMLYTATRAHAKAMQTEADTLKARDPDRAPPPQHKDRAYLSAQLHDKILFIANTGLRPDEANNLQYRDVSIILDEESDETILEIDVRGKRGVGICKSTAGAVFPFKRLLERNKPAPTDLLFPNDHKKQFNRILEDLGLKHDRDGNSRSFYSLRHSYISFRLLDGADIYQVAKNCRTSVEMIEKHYAIHLKNSINAADINVKRRKPTKKQQERFAELNAHRGEY